MNAIGAYAGVIVDRFVGEPPNAVHPVVGYARLMNTVERITYRDRRSNGVAFCVIGVATGVSVGLLARRLFGARLATVAASTVCIAGRMLDHEAQAVGQLITEGDLVAARRRVRSLVGRAPDDLDESDLCRAVVESVAENGVDAVTSSVVWAAIGGAPAVLAHRAVNTLDAMVGHRSARYERFGWASARLDDAMNFVPARLTALSVACVRPTRARAVWRAVRHDAPHHPSPNGGVIEAAFAASLDVQLGGVNQYGDRIEHRGTLGTGALPTVDTVNAAIQLRRTSAHVVAAICALIWWSVHAN